MTRVFITADTHFCHEKAVNFVGRQGYMFKSWEDMNEEIVYRWNSAVGGGDTVIHLGDVALCGGEDVKRQALDDVMQRLNGTLYLVAGNHDQEWVYPYFDRVWGVRERKNCILSHIPVHESQKERFRYNIHGHLHDNVVTGQWPRESGPGLCDPVPDPWYFCASVEQTNLAPVPWDDITHTMNERLGG